MASRKFRITIDGKIFEAEVEELGGEITAAPAIQQQKTAQKPIQQKETPTPTSAAGKAIVAPMPGKIISIKVKSGQQIKKGEIVLVLEAMKMEQEIKSEYTGVVSSINISEGDTVKKDQALILLG
jgi:biotin carboxyl carrier protein